LPFICEQCFDEEVQEIQPGQWWDRVKKNVCPK
jgi:hypothetical protein